MERLKQQLQAEEIRFIENESLAAHCTFKIGGPADVFARPETEAATSCLRMRATGAWSWIPRL